MYQRIPTGDGLQPKVLYTVVPILHGHFLQNTHNIRCISRRDMECILRVVNIWCVSQVFHYHVISKQYGIITDYIIVQERHNSIPLAMELLLFCTNPSIRMFNSNMPSTNAAFHCREHIDSLVIFLQTINKLTYHGEVGVDCSVSSKFHQYPILIISMPLVIYI